MPQSLIDIYLALPAFALVLFRMSGLFLTAPIYGSNWMPLRIRAALCMALAWITFPTVVTRVPAALNMGEALVGGVGELLVGMSLGLSIALLLMSAEVTGALVGQQAGLSLGEVFNPLQNEPSSLFGQLYAIVLTLVFLSVGGHRAAASSLMDSYRSIPPLAFRFDDSAMLLLLNLMGSAFVMGIRMGGPVLIALFLTETAMGLLSRTMPQMNILTIGFGIRGIVTLAVAALSLAACEGLMVEAIHDGLALIRESFGLTADLGMGVR